MTALLPRILLVEPQFVLRRTIVIVARDLGMVDFHEASSVGRARTLLAAQTYDGLVLDLHEEQQALELLGELRLGRFATARDARVVVLAADAKPDAKPDAASRLQALGATCVLNKPVRISDLLNMLVAAQAC